MNEILCKAYDIIKEEQRNADNKAYIFVVILGGILGYIATTPMPTETFDMIGLTMFILIVATPVMILLYSLFPKYRVDDTKNSIDYELPLNIFFWKSLVKFNSIEAFTKCYIKEYKDFTLDRFDYDMLRQIFKNAKIMHKKSLLHRIALMFILVLVYIFIITILYMIFSTLPVWLISILILLGLVGLPIIYFIKYYLSKSNNRLVGEKILIHEVEKLSSMKCDEHRLYAKRIFKFLSTNKDKMISYSKLADSNEVDYKYKHNITPSQFRSNISVTLGVLGIALKDLELPYIQSLVVLEGQNINGDGYYNSFSRNDDFNTKTKDEITKNEIEMVKEVNWSLWEQRIIQNIDRVIIKKDIKSI